MWARPELQAPERLQTPGRLLRAACRAAAAGNARDSGARGACVRGLAIAAPRVYRTTSPTRGREPGPPEGEGASRRTRGRAAFTRGSFDPDLRPSMSSKHVADGRRGVPRGSARRVCGPGERITWDPSNARPYRAQSRRKTVPADTGRCSPGPETARTSLRSCAVQAEKRRARNVAKRVVREGRGQSTAVKTGHNSARSRGGTVHIKGWHRFGATNHVRCRRDSWWMRDRRTAATPREKHVITSGIPIQHPRASRQEDGKTTSPEPDERQARLKTSSSERNCMARRSKAHSPLCVPSIGVEGGRCVSTGVAGRDHPGRQRNGHAPVRRFFRLRRNRTAPNKPRGLRLRLSRNGVSPVEDSHPRCERKPEAPTKT